MRNYSDPEAEIIYLGYNDIVSTSDGTTPGGGNSDTETPDDDLWPTY